MKEDTKQGFGVDHVYMTEPPKQEEKPAEKQDEKPNNKKDKE